MSNDIIPVGSPLSENDSLHHFDKPVSIARIDTRDELPALREGLDQYRQLAQRTAATQFHPKKVSYVGLYEALSDLAGAARCLDEDKKSFAYGKGDDLPDEDSLAAATPYRKCGITDAELHGFLGIMTEAGEIAELLLTAFETWHYDRTNAIEEVSDAIWYVPEFAKGAGVDPYDVFMTAIEKLRKRFPEKFTREDALVRDLNTERKTMENHLSPSLFKITEQGSVRVNGVDSIYGGSDVILVRLDAKTKRGEAFSPGLSNGRPVLWLTDTEDSVHANDDLPRGTPTVINFPGMVGYDIVSASYNRYTVSVCFLRTDAPAQQPAKHN